MDGILYGLCVAGPGEGGARHPFLQREVSGVGHGDVLRRNRELIPVVHKEGAADGSDILARHRIAKLKGRDSCCCSCGVCVAMLSIVEIEKESPGVRWFRCSWWSLPFVPFRILYSVFSHAILHFPELSPEIINGECSLERIPVGSSEEGGKGRGGGRGPHDNELFGFIFRSEGTFQMLLHDLVREVTDLVTHWHLHRGRIQPRRDLEPLGFPDPGDVLYGLGCGVVKLLRI
jgi:hypothetical protein